MGKVFLLFFIYYAPRCLVASLPYSNGKYVCESGNSQVASMNEIECSLFDFYVIQVFGVFDIYKYYSIKYSLSFKLTYFSTQILGLYLLL